MEWNVWLLAFLLSTANNLLSRFVVLISRNLLYFFSSFLYVNYKFRTGFEVNLGTCQNRHQMTVSMTVDLPAFYF